MWSDGFTKHHGPKIFDALIGMNAKGLFALAGSGDHAKALFQQLETSAHGKHLSLPDIKALFSTEVANFYNIHSASIGTSGLALLIAIVHETDGMSLLVCSNSTCREAHGAYEFIGCGASIAKPLADWLYSPFMNDVDRRQLGFTVLYAVESVDPNCDGPTQFGHLRKEGDFVIDTRGVPDEDKYVAEFFRASGKALFKCAPGYPDTISEAEIERLIAKIRQIRGK